MIPRRAPCSLFQNRRRPLTANRHFTRYAAQNWNFQHLPTDDCCSLRYPRQATATNGQNYRRNLNLLAGSFRVPCKVFTASYLFDSYLLSQEVSWVDLRLRFEACYCYLYRRQSWQEVAFYEFSIKEHQSSQYHYLKSLDQRASSPRIEATRVQHQFRKPLLAFTLVRSHYSHCC